MAKRYYQQPSESDEVLTKAVNDPNCKNQQECLEVLERRKTLKAAREEREVARAAQEKIRRRLSVLNYRTILLTGATKFPQTRSTSRKSLAGESLRTCGLFSSRCLLCWDFYTRF
jgi:hypothetical protein